jgi:hypothetical protein
VCYVDWRLNRFEMKAEVVPILLVSSVFLKRKITPLNEATSFASPNKFILVYADPFLDPTHPKDSDRYIAVML